jgi:hypothetical protein
MDQDHQELMQVVEVEDLVTGTTSGTGGPGGGGAGSTSQLQVLQEQLILEEVVEVEDNGPCSGAAGGSGIVIVQEKNGGYNAPGVWSINDAYNYKKAGQWVLQVHQFSVDYLVVAGRRWRWIRRVGSGGGGGGAEV